MFQKKKKKETKKKIIEIAYRMSWTDHKTKKYITPLSVDFFFRMFLFPDHKASFKVLPQKSRV